MAKGITPMISVLGINELNPVEGTDFLYTVLAIIVIFAIISIVIAFGMSKFHTPSKNKSRKWLPDDWNKE